MNHKKVQMVLHFLHPMKNWGAHVARDRSGDRRPVTVQISRLPDRLTMLGALCLHWSYTVWLGQIQVKPYLIHQRPVKMEEEKKEDPAIQKQLCF